MISAIIFTGHLVFLLYIFTKKWQDESLQSAFLNLVFIVILFSVGWSISTMFVKLFFDPQGLGIHFDRDAISLSLLSIIEVFFYRMYYKEKATPDDKET